ncbi:uncharacterized protein F5891DRAFT_1055173 [Suillus fuscotomentosus]|uniref:Uncharacterized protein n=1 Tax=Suillus fuscotomentosus TaxID=1912939 RepID=A0AAD4DYS0_9AGAM|nr:uncharacterized protein F5891DRAFT_1055173 [Suillus fuscotomentosus]KAG1896117.1 hypothetical protein F5891DRAFT_1055173 [Suillus fuscotomentosus]
MHPSKERRILTIRRYALNFMMILLLCAVLFGVPVCSRFTGFTPGILPLFSNNWQPSPDSRTLWVIMSSCGLTLFACTWTAVPPDIPRLGEGVVVVTVRRLLLMFVAYFAPELMAAWAAWQLICARQVAKDFNDVLGAQRAAAQPNGDCEAAPQSSPAVVLPNAVSKSNESSSAGWTETHGFFAGMGGFLLYVDGKPWATLTPDELLRFVCEGSVEMPVITKADIEDRSKGDVLSRCITILQLGWFFIQIIARYGQHLPTTLLELDTLAVVLLTIDTYGLLWWRKPKDVQRPHIVHWNPNFPPPHECLANDKRRTPILLSVLFNRKVRRSHTSARNMTTFLAGGGSGVLFAAMHTLGWNFVFPSHAERILWRMSFVGKAGLSLTMWSLWYLDTRPSEYKGLSGKALYFLSVNLMKIIGVLGVIYILARFAIITLIMLSLRSLPQGVYDTIAWTKFIPHVGT